MVAGAEAVVSILKTKTRPKRLRLLGSDGHRYIFLLKVFCVLMCSAFRSCCHKKAQDPCVSTEVSRGPVGSGFICMKLCCYACLHLFLVTVPHVACQEAARYNAIMVSVRQLNHSPVTARDCPSIVNEHSRLLTEFRLLNTDRR